MAGNHQPNNNGYIARLEETVRALTNEVRELKSNNVERGKKTNMKEMQETFGWSGEDVMLSAKVMRFCGEFLFSRYKFIDKTWLEYSTERKSFCRYVINQMNITGEYDCKREWDRVISKSINKKYTDMRCNLNTAVRKAYLCEYYYYCVIILYISLTSTLIYFHCSLKST